MNSRSAFVPVLAAAFLLAACSSGPKNYNAADFQANKEAYAKSFVDVSSAGVLDESKKVIIPDFKVYFQTEAKGAATTGNFLSQKNHRVSGKLRLAVDPKVMQEITDQAYAKTKAELTALGYEVVEPAQLAEQFPEFAKYQAGMKPSPANIDDQYMAFAPTGWKLEQPGLELGKAMGAQLIGAFSTSLLDVSARATKKLKAIRIQPVFIVSFGYIESDKGYSSATVTAKQGIYVLPGTKFATMEAWSMGHLLLQKPVGQAEDYGRIIDASTAGDTVRGIASGLAGLFGANKHESGTWLLEADADKFKSQASASLDASIEMFTARMKQELR